MIPTRYLALDRPGTLEFSGSECALAFQKIVSESLDGVLSHNFQDSGFISASIEGRPWDGTFWSRDSGAFLRELVHFGYFGHAARAAEYLIDHAGLNEAGYHSFPEHAAPGEVKAGRELDGTCAILVALAALNGRLLALDEPQARESASRILAFATGPASPLRDLLSRLERTRLIAGTGEFGGGMGVEGAWCNAVQNALAVYALRAWADELAALNQSGLSQALMKGSDRLLCALKQTMIVQGEFVLCVRPDTLLPDRAMLSLPVNAGFAGINGIGAMSADVPTFFDDMLMEAAERTYEALLRAPLRKSQFERFGLYAQNDLFCHGLLTSPAYGQGYALQLSLLLGKLDHAAQMLNYLTFSTIQPPDGYSLTRTNPHWLYERMLSPDYFKLPADQQNIPEGCGALNLVNVAEPLKVARLIAGAEQPTPNAPARPRFIEGIDRVALKNWPAFEGRVLHFVTQEYRK